MIVDQQEIGAMKAAAAKLAGPNVKASAPAAGSSRGCAPPPPELARILRLTVPVLVRIAERPYPVANIMKLSPGAIIEFDKSGESELDLMINNAVIGRGTAVRLNEKFGLRVTSIGDVAQRIRSMDGAGLPPDGA